MPTVKEHATAELDARWKQAFRRRLLAWYDKHERDLPWRRSSDPYRVWLSEVMLQQTQVATVCAYFERFTTAFPTVHELAAADEQQVLRLWEGLGYYRRARSLHAAAKQVVAEWGGTFPRTAEELQELPGVGRYTAGAIASIAYDQRAPILEANTIRLLARLLAYGDDPTKSAGQKLLWATAEEILPQKNIARFNQALMELGSLVCTPTQPGCDVCPVAPLCHARRSGAEHEIPRLGKKMQYIDVREAAVVVCKQDKVLLRRCLPGERWAGLWDFPRFAIEGEGPLFAQKEIAAKVRQQTGIAIHCCQLLTTLKHGVTKFRITLDCFRAAFKAGKLLPAEQASLRWLEVSELHDMPLSTTGRKIARLVATDAG